MQVRTTNVVEGFPTPVGKVKGVWGRYPTLMLEAIILMIIVIMMAKRKPSRRGRSMANYVRGAVDEELDLGTLAARTLISTPFDEVARERLKVTSVIATYSLSDVTVATGDGPVLIGLAHSDYSDPEIEAYIENSGSWDQGDLTQQEVSRRKIRRIGVFESKDLAAEVAVLNDGKPIKTKLNWIMKTGQTVDLWAYNMGSSAFATTNPTLRAAGHANIFIL